MPLLDITKPEVIKFLIESYEKEARLRLNWVDKHAAAMQDAATIDKEKGHTEEHVLKAAFTCGLPSVSRDFKSSSLNRRVKVKEDAAFVQGIKYLRKGHSILEIGLGDSKEDPRLARPDTDLSTDPIMKPVKPEENKILYKDKPSYGRLQYLKRRQTKKPEDRFYFQEVGAWDYGWRQQDSELLKGSGCKHPRVYQLTRGIMTRTGPQPDPPHYRPAQTNIPTSSCFS